VSVVKKLRERFINFWKSNLFDNRNSANGKKLCTYGEFKTEYTLEIFLLLDLDKLDIYPTLFMGFKVGRYPVLLPV
jgi:hypothetical protein